MAGFNRILNYNIVFSVSSKLTPNRTNTTNLIQD